MKLGILCTMINGFGRRGYYNSQEVGLGRALAAMGHELTIYKGIDPSEEEEKVVVVPGLVVWYLPMRHLGAHGWMPVSALDARLRAGCRDEGIVLLWRPAAFSAPHLPLVQKTRGGIRTLHRHGTQPE